MLAACRDCEEVSASRNGSRRATTPAGPTQVGPLRTEETINTMADTRTILPAQNLGIKRQAPALTRERVQAMRTQQTLGRGKSKVAIYGLRAECVIFVLRVREQFFGSIGAND